MQEPKAGRPSPSDSEGTDLPLSEMVTEALKRSGIEAVVVEKSDSLEMYGKDGLPLSVDAGADLKAWSTLPLAVKQRKAHALATRLAHLYHSRSPAKEEGLQMPPLSRLIPFAVGLGIGIVVFVGMRLTREKPKPPPPAGMPSESDQQRNNRLSRACEATRTMFWKGGNWGSMPLEGWTVELWLARTGNAPLASDPALLAALDKGRLSSKADGSLAAIEDGKAAIEDGALSPAIPGARIVLREGYARSFFEIQMRDRFVGLGEKLVRETKADYGALWARCSHQTAREVGAWFYGQNEKYAAAALLYAMGKPHGSTAVDHVPVAADFGAITALTNRLADQDFVTIAQTDGARASTSEGVSLLFPFDPQTRAGQSSKRLAEKLGF